MDDSVCLTVLGKPNFVKFRNASLVLGSSQLLLLLQLPQNLMLNTKMFKMSHK